MSKFYNLPVIQEEKITVTFYGPIETVKKLNELEVKQIQVDVKNKIVSCDKFVFISDSGQVNRLNEQGFFIDIWAQGIFDKRYDLTTKLLLK